MQTEFWHHLVSSRVKPLTDLLYHPVRICLQAAWTPSRKPIIILDSHVEYSLQEGWWVTTRTPSSTNLIQYKYSFGITFFNPQGTCPRLMKIVWWEQISRLHLSRCRSSLPFPSSIQDFTTLLSTTFPLAGTRAQLLLSQKHSLAVVYSSAVEKPSAHV